MIQSILIEKLRSYIIQNNLDLLLRLQQDFSVTQYLENKVSGIMPQLEQWIGDGKPQYIIEELAMNELTSDLKPSKFNYIRKILEEEFGDTFNKWREMGVLTYEIINLIEASEPVFEKLGFTEDKAGERSLRYAIIAETKKYLDR